MRNITKVSEITADDVAEYLRLPDPDLDDTTLLNNLILISKTFIKNYTGVAEDKIDDYPDFTIVVFILCQDMWDNRTLHIENSNLSYPVQTILGMHSVNLL